MPYSLFVRVAAVGVCLFAAVRATQLARAEWLASLGTLDGIERAIRMEPGEGNWLATAAVFRSDSGDLSQAVDRDLERAAKLNPLDSRVPMTLGLRAEFRGELANAERFLLQAVAMDKQFKPSWTLANFYIRRNVPAKAWPLLRHCLELEPLGYDPDPVFDLAWNAEPDSKTVLTLVPRRNPRLIQYLSYLVKTKRVDAVAELWPDAMRVVDTSAREDMSLLNPLPAFLASGGRPLEAIDLWNRMVDRGILRAGRLGAGQGLSLADPDFTYGLTQAPFGWAFTEPGGVFGSMVDASMRFEIDGTEPESFDMVYTAAAVLPGRHYKLGWSVDGSQLDLPNDPGFAIQVAPTEGGPPIQCELLVGVRRSCAFSTTDTTRLVNLALIYRRAPGTVRPHGVLRLMKVRIERQS